LAISLRIPAFIENKSALQSSFVHLRALRGYY